jgi:hypothetical protein
LPRRAPRICGGAPQRAGENCCETSAETFFSILFRKNAPVKAREITAKEKPNFVTKSLFVLNFVITFTSNFENNFCSE